MHVTALSVQTDHSGPKTCDVIAVVPVVIVSFPLVLRNKAVKQISHGRFWVLLLEILLAIWEWVVVAKTDEQIASTESTDDFLNDWLECGSDFALTYESVIMRSAVTSPEKVVVALTFYIVKSISESV